MSTPANGKFKPLIWANVYLNSQQKEAAKLFMLPDGAFESRLATLLEDGYKVSLSFNEQNQSFICTLTGTDKCRENQGVGMTSHGGSWFAAASRGLYKHFVLSEGRTWLDAAAESETPDT